MTTPTPERAAELPELRALLSEACDLLHTAAWAAGKLNAEMILRGTIARRAELEALVDKRDAIRDFRSRARAALAAARPSEAPFAFAWFYPDGKPYTLTWAGEDAKRVEGGHIKLTSEPLYLAAAPRPEVPPPDVVDPAQALRQEAGAADECRWLHIASAPDGCEVDLWMHVYASPRSMGWSDDFRVPNAYRRGDVWFHRTESGAEKQLRSDYITHWMPLPEPPSTASGNQPEAPEPDVQAQSGVRPEVLQEAVAHTSERHFALREAHSIAAEGAYFEPRPVEDGAMQRRAFQAGFSRGFDAGEKVYATPPEPQHAASPAEPPDEWFHEDSLTLVGWKYHSKNDGDGTYRLITPNDTYNPDAVTPGSMEPVYSRKYA